MDDIIIHFPPSTTCTADKEKKAQYSIYMLRSSSPPIPTSLHFTSAYQRERENMTGLKIYVDRMSQPSRAVIIFCKVNKIEFEEIKIELFKGQHRSTQFKEINPMGQVPAITHGRFKLFESHAILSYLACAFPGVSDHWYVKRLRKFPLLCYGCKSLSGLVIALILARSIGYPADLFERAKIQSVLDWHHSNLRRGAASYVLNSTLAPAFGLPLNPQAAAEAEKILSKSLSIIESFWLEGNAQFLLGRLQPSIADLSLVCEIMELEILDEKDRDRILGPHKKILQWIENLKHVTEPHFDEAHEILYKAKAGIHKQLQAAGNRMGTSTDTTLPSNSDDV